MEYYVYERENVAYLEDVWYRHGPVKGCKFSLAKDIRYFAENKKNHGHPGWGWRWNLYEPKDVVRVFREALGDDDADAIEDEPEEVLLAAAAYLLERAAEDRAKHEPSVWA